jgi:hypothetical protein
LGKLYSKYTRIGEAMSYYNYTTNNSNSGGRKCESQGKANNTSTSEKSFSDLSYKEKLSEQV